MVNTSTRSSVVNFVFSSIGAKLSLFFLLFATTSLYGSPEKYWVGGPTASAIPMFTTIANETTTFVINGAFMGDDLTYTAVRMNGQSLPSWIKLDGRTGTFTFTTPASSIGVRMGVRVTATDRLGDSATTDFYVNVDAQPASCTLEANTDRLDKILDCNTQKVTLRGMTASGRYAWSGPNNFYSTSKEPTVSTPGLYLLIDAGGRCERSGAVQVYSSANDCKSQTDKNIIPTATLRADRNSGQGPLTVNFDASGSKDADGSIRSYHLAWDGGEATGAKPVVTFYDGSYEVTLTVTDNTGAKSTDRMSVAVSDDLKVGISYWLEAECAEVGSNWATKQDGKAAGGSYVTPGRSSTSRAPDDKAEHRIRFTFDAKADEYSFFARVLAESAFKDSYWVRINGGSWFEWKSGIDVSKDFLWHGFPKKISLRDGRNDIDFAYREAGVKLDKIVLTSTTDLPKGMGGQAGNCSMNNPPIARAVADIYTGNAPLNVKLDGTKSSDSDNKIVKYDWKWQGGSTTGATAGVTFPAGNYSVSLTVTDESGDSDTDVIAIQSKTPTNQSIGTPIAGGSEIWLEAECAEVGGKWSVEASSSASEGLYVLVKGTRSTNSVPADKAENRVRFSFSAKAGTYQLFARISASHNLADSYWVRVNGGSWYEWKSGIDYGEGFRWNLLPGAGLSLNDGNNTVDFAFREEGTKLDKLMLTTSRSTVPSGNGPAATNCGSNMAFSGSSVWMEAECAEAGTGWKSEVSIEASRKSYLVYQGQNTGSTPAVDKAAEQLKFKFNLAIAGAYKLYLRLDAPDVGANSVWVRVDNGNWILFGKETDGTELLTEGMEWKEVNNNGKLLVLNLSAGSHVITINNREAGTGLDKLHLSASGKVPGGYGEHATNCVSSTTMGSLATTSGQTITTEGESDDSTIADLLLYPNPVSDWLNVEMTSDFSGDAEITVIDITGRRVLQQRLVKTAGLATTRVQVAMLPSGMYHLRIIEGDRQTVKPFVKR